jgi:hypothetical protein
MRRRGGRGRIAPVQDQVLIVVAGINRPGQDQLFLVVHALDAGRLHFRADQRRQQQGRQNGDDRDYHQEFHERERRR